MRESRDTEAESGRGCTRVKALSSSIVTSLGFWKFMYRTVCKKIEV